MDRGYLTRIKLGITVIVVVALKSNLWQLKGTLASFRAAPQVDDISQYERRFTQVKHFLSPDQLVSYRDEFANVAGQCNTFVLAQYSLAPTVLDPMDPGCDVSVTGETSSHEPRLVLGNSLDPEHDPYLLHLFPSSYFQPRNNEVSLAGGRLSRADRLVFLNDVGLGVRLYTRGDK